MTTDTAPPPTTAAGRRLLVLLIAMASVGPLSVNIIIPAIPGLALSLKADPAAVQLTISLFFAGLATAQLVLGALSDRFGRRPVLLTGFLITVITSFAAAAATGIASLVVARTLQAFGASTGIVIGRAIVRDLYSRDRAASMLGWVTMSTVVIPMFGPLIGGLLDEWWGWRSIFIFVGCSALVVVVWAMVSLPETRPPQAAAAMSFRQLGKESRALLSTPAFAGFALCAGMISGPYYAMLGAAPQVVITQMGRSPAELGLWFMLSSLGYMLGNYIAGRFSARFGIYAMIWWGLVLEFAGTAAGVALVPLADTLGPLAIFAPITVIFVANGIALPSAIAGAVSVRPQAAGTASGVAGFAQMGCGALISQLMTYPMAGATTAMPMTIAMLAIAIAGLAIYWLLIRPYRVS
ncbi:MAG: Bcr/CflA family efflux MFS transporter [Rhizobiales bacterium]|nr:Bcr/CflA family efflux MFS transporter [Hyphomicrobiales bacterium]